MFECQCRAQLDKAVAARLLVILPGLGAMFTAHALYASLTSGFAGYEVFVPVLSAAVCFLLGTALADGSERVRWAHPAGVAAAAMLLLNIVCRPLVLSRPEGIALMMVVPIGAGLTFLSYQWLATVLAISAGTWELATWGNLSLGDLVIAAPVLLGGAGLSIWLHHVRLVRYKKMFLHRGEQEREKGEAARVKEQYDVAIGGADHGLWFWDLKTDKIDFSPQWKSMLGYSEDEIGTDPEEWFGRVHTFYLSLLKKDLEAHLSGETPRFESKYRIRHRDGSHRWMMVRGQALGHERGGPKQIAGSQTDITSLIEVEKGLIYDAMHDQLTGLPNRNYLMRQLQRAHQHGRLFAVLFLDLDRFKIINDSLGHLVGDQLLKVTAKRLKSSVRDGDMVGRLGGDEFLVLLNTLENVDDAQRLAHRIQKTLGIPFQVDGNRVATSASVGIAFSEGSRGPEDLLRNADIAMYDAKAQRKGISVFNTEMRGQMVKAWEFQRDVRKAVNQDELVLHYQPLISLENLQMVGAEALLRWRRPNGELMPPAELIPQAEELGLIGEIGEWVLRTACDQHRKWKRFGPPYLRIAVNVSVSQLKENSFASTVMRILDQAKLDPAYLEVEVTESALVEAESEAFRNLCALSDSGVKIAIDDFGTGFSCLDYLTRLPLSTLKFDRSFVAGILEDEKSAALLDGLIATAHRLGVQVTAEGVEYEEQVPLLRSYGCDTIQGYLVSRPVPAKQFDEFLRSRRHVPDAGISDGLDWGRKSLEESELQVAGHFGR